MNSTDKLTITDFIFLQDILSTNPRSAQILRIDQGEVQKLLSDYSITVKARYIDTITAIYRQFGVYFQNEKTPIDIDDKNILLFISETNQWFVIEVNQ